MRPALATLLALGLALTLWTGAQGQDKKEPGRASHRLPLVRRPDFVDHKLGRAHEMSASTSAMAQKPPNIANPGVPM